MKIIVSPGPTFSANPFFKLLNAELESLGHTLTPLRLRHVFEADLFNVNFPEHMVSEKKSLFSAAITAFTMLCFMFVIRARKRPIVWTVHDVLPLRGHYPQLCAVYMAIVRKMISGYIFLSLSSRRKFEELYLQECKKPFLVAFHPAFPVRLLEKGEKEKIRKGLGAASEDFVIGFLGDIKPYKNPEVLRHIPTHLDDGRQTLLLVAGRADGVDTTYAKHLAQQRHIHINKRLADEELTDLIQAVDVVFLPYMSGWNSGFLLLVLSCHQKSVTSDLPIFIEIKNYVGASWLSIFNLEASDPKRAISGALNQASTAVCNAVDLDQLTHNLNECSFARLAASVQSFYLSLK